MSLESLLFEFHEQRWESVVQSLGTPECLRFPIPSVDRARLRELASYGMVVVEPPGFVPCSSPLLFRRSYLGVSTTVDELFSKQWLIGSMLIMAVEISGQWEGRGFRTSVRNAWGAIVLPCDHDNGLRGS